jgi:hypothetical protein
MDSTYEIFKEEPQGPIWMETVVGLERASERLAALCKQKPATYFAYDAHKSQIVAKVSAEQSSAGVANPEKRKRASGAA